MVLDVSGRANQSLFFTTPQGKTDGATRLLAERSNGARRLHHHRRSRSIVLRARAVIPGIEVSTNQDPFVRMLASGNLGDRIVDLHRTARLVFKRKLNSNRSLLQFSANQLAIFHPELSSGKRAELSSPI